MFFKMKVQNLVLYFLLVFFKEPIECGCFHEDTRLIERPGKNLCVKKNYYKDVDCSNQVNYGSHASCLMKYLNKTSKECGESEFKGEVDTTDYYGTVKLKPFAWFDNGILFPSLNITFTNIQWEYLRMRFIKVGSRTPTICREFLVSEDLDPATEISFDCLWGNGATAGEHYRFQYTMLTKDGHKFLYTYLLQIPKDMDVEESVTTENYRLFIIMDRTKFPLISLKLQVPPARLNISSASVVLFYQSEVDSAVEKLNQWTVELSDKEEGEFIKLDDFNTKNTPGYYYYNATFASVLCENTCIESSTPQLYIAGFRHAIQVIFAVIFITIAMLGLVTFMLWRRKYKKLFYEGEKPPNVLLVYESSFPSHIENIYKFKQFLEDNCYISPKMDLIDIPKSDSVVRQNPWRWYYMAFEEADYVLVFASPTPEAAERGLHEDNVYQGLHAYATRLLGAHVLHGQKFLGARVRLPGCSWDTMPPEACAIEKEFALPEKLSHLLKFLNVPPVSGGGSKLLTALQQPRSVPRITVTPPVAPLSLPFDKGSVKLEELAREPLTVRGVTLKLDGQLSSSDDSESGEEDPSLTGFKL